MPLSNIGEALRRMRLDAGYKQSELEAMLKWTAGSVSRIENSNRTGCHRVSAYLGAMKANAHDLARRLDEVNGQETPGSSHQIVLTGASTRDFVQQLADTLLERVKVDKGGE